MLDYRSVNKTDGRSVWSVWSSRLLPDLGAIFALMHALQLEDRILTTTSSRIISHQLSIITIHHYHKQQQWLLWSMMMLILSNMFMFYLCLRCCCHHQCVELGFRTPLKRERPLKSRDCFFAVSCWSWGVLCQEKLPLPLYQKNLNVRRNSQTTCRWTKTHIDSY